MDPQRHAIKRLVARHLRRLGLASGLLVAGPGCLNVPDDASADPGAVTVPSTATEILDRHVEALGGEKMLRAVAQRTVEARVTFLPQAGCTEGDPNCVAEATTGQFMLNTTADGRMFRRMVVGKLVSERGYDGSTGWELQGEPRMLILDDEITGLASREDALLHWYLDYDKRNIKPSIESPRTTDFDGERRDLDGIAWTNADGRLAPRQYWFDRLTGLLREEVESDPAGQLRRTVIYDDYREIDGVQVPHRILQITELATEAGETRQDVEIVVQRVHHAEIRPQIFEVPQMPAPEPIPDELLMALEDAKKAAKANPKDPSAQFRYASGSWMAGRFDDARDGAKRLLKLAPKDPAALFILGRAELLAGDYKRAERSLKLAQKAGAHPERVAHHLATVKLHRKDYAGAKKLFETAGEAALAERYGAFQGKPLRASWGGDGCKTTLPLVADIPVPVIEAEIDGEKKMLVVDTSAADLILDPEQARKLVISPDSRSELGGPGGAEIGHGQADKVVMGDLTLQAVPVDIFPTPVLADMAVDPRVNGVLGVRPCSTPRSPSTRPTTSSRSFAMRASASRRSRATARGSRSRFGCTRRTCCTCPR